MSMNGYGEVNQVRTGFRLRVCFCFWLRQAKLVGVTRSNPYLTVAPDRHKANRDSDTNGSISALYCATP